MCGGDDARDFFFFPGLAQVLAHTHFAHRQLHSNKIFPFRGIFLSAIFFFKNPMDLISHLFFRKAFQGLDKDSGVILARGA